MFTKKQFKEWGKQGAAKAQRDFTKEHFTEWGKLGGRPRKPGDNSTLAKPSPYVKIEVSKGRTH